MLVTGYAINQALHLTLRAVVHEGKVSRGQVTPVKVIDTNNVVFGEVVDDITILAAICHVVLILILRDEEVRIITRTDMPSFYLDIDWATAPADKVKDLTVFRSVPEVLVIRLVLVVYI
jgi:hypothetical protein